jgi:hypothetical protein
MQQGVGTGRRGGQDRKPELLLGRADQFQRGHLHAGGDDQRVGAGQIQAARRVHDPVARDAADFGVVGDLEGGPVEDLDAFRFDIVHDLLRQRPQVGGDESDPGRAEGGQGLEQGAGAGQDHGPLAGPGELAGLDELSGDGVFGAPVLAGALRHDGHQAGVEQGVDPGVGEFVDAPFTLGVHGPQLLGRDGVHPHPAGVEGEPRTGVPGQQRRYLGFDGDVRAGHDQPDAMSGH